MTLILKETAFVVQQYNISNRIILQTKNMRETNTYINF